jgi:hypothetical protein
VTLSQTLPPKKTKQTKTPKQNKQAKSNGDKVQGSLEQGREKLIERIWKGNTNFCKAL